MKNYETKHSPNLVKECRIVLKMVLQEMEAQRIDPEDDYWPLREEVRELLYKLDQISTGV